MLFPPHQQGINDGGGENPLKDLSQDLFLDFLEVPKDHSRRTRKGVYSSHVFGLPPNQVKLIMLDTRYHRDTDFISRLGGSKSVPGAALIAAFLRFVSSFVGLGYNYDGDVLHEEQWKWLESQLSKSQADVHVIVSSIQVPYARRC